MLKIKRKNNKILFKKKGKNIRNEFISLSIILLDNGYINKIDIETILLLGSELKRGVKGE